MATYTINVRNQSGETKSYFVFQALPVVTSPGGETPIYANAWATFENVTDGAYDSVVYAKADVADGNAASLAAPRFYVSEGDYTPGQVIDASLASDAATVDFTGMPQTMATVTQDADSGFSVTYS